MVTRTENIHRARCRVNASRNVWPFSFCCVGLSPAQVNEISRSEAATASFGGRGLRSFRSGGDGSPLPLVRWFIYPRSCIDVALRLRWSTYWAISFTQGPCSHAFSWRASRIKTVDPFFDCIASRISVPIEFGTSSSFSLNRRSVCSDNLRNKESWDMVDAALTAFHLSHTKGVR